MTASPYFPALFHLLPETVTTTFGCIGLEYILPHPALLRLILSSLLTSVIYILFLYYKKHQRQKLKEEKRRLKKERQKMKMAAAL
jgi:hypothetical protein